jgi:hypothetical protein
MSSDILYSCLMDSTWFFLAAWMLLLLGAGFRAFRHDVANTPPLRHLESEGHD